MRLGPAALDVTPDLLTAATPMAAGGSGDGVDRLSSLDPATLAADGAVDHRRLAPDIRADHDPGAPVGIRIDLVSCLESLRPERIAAAIIATNGLTAPPVPVAEIADAAGIDRIVEGRLGEARGALLLDTAPPTGDAGATILYRRGRTRSHDPRTIGHERGHFLMRHHHGPFLCSDRAMFGSEGDPPAGIARTGETDAGRVGADGLRQREAEANRFANHLLVPERFLARSLAESDQNPLAFAAPQHRLYGLTIEPMIRRLVERCPTPVVVVKLPSAPDQPACPIWNGAARQRIVRPGLSDRRVFAAAVTAARRTKEVIEVPITVDDWFLGWNGGAFPGDAVPALALCDYPGAPFERTWIWCPLSPV